MQKKVNQEAREIFFTLFKLNTISISKCYLHHNCSVNLNWNNRQLYSSAKPLHNVPSSVLWFVNFCFLPLSGWTGIQKWKKKWFCYVDKWMHKNEMLASISKCLCQNLFKGAASYIRAVYKNYRILVTLKRCITSSFKFLDSQNKIYIVLWLSNLRKHFLFIWGQCK